jgi:heptosyltransferase-2
VQVAKEKIAVILPNHLGDVTMATPALRALRRGRPEAEITGVVREELAPVLRANPALDRILTHRVYHARSWLARFARRLAVARELGAVDIVIVLPNSFSSALWALETRAPRRLGYARRGRALLLSDPVAPPRRNGRFAPVAMERYYLDLVSRLGCAAAGTELELHLEESAERECEALFARAGVQPGRPLVLIAPGAAFGSSKLWPARYFAEVARGLLSDGSQVALAHAPSEQRLADEIIAAVGPGLQSLGGAPMTLPLLKSAMARAQLLICNDSGARHVAAAFRVPALVLMGPTSLDYTNLNLARTRVLREPVDCAPCHLRVCPIDHRCMTRLLPARVLAEARRALGDADWRGDTELELRA